jgi:hypothetical protein
MTLVLILVGTSAWTMEPIRRLAVEDLDGDSRPELILVDHDAQEVRAFTAALPGPLDETSSRAFAAPNPVDVLGGGFSLAQTSDVAVSSWPTNTTHLFPTEKGKLGPPFPIEQDGAGPTRLRSGAFADELGRDLLVMFALSNRITLYGPRIGGYPPTLSPYARLNPDVYQIRDLAVGAGGAGGSSLVVLGESEGGTAIYTYSLVVEFLPQFVLQSEIRLSENPSRIEALQSFIRIPYLMVAYSQPADHLLFFRPNPSLAPVGIELPGEYSHLVPADLDGNGIPDFALLRSDGQEILLLYCDVEGFFNQQALPNPGSEPIVETAIGDFRFADVFDLVAYYRSGFGLSKPGDVQALAKGFWFFPGDGSGGFGVPTRFEIPFRVSQPEGYPNVVLLKKPIPSQGAATVYQSFHVDDWTTAIGPVTAGEATVERAITSGGHLVDATPVNLTGIHIPGAAVDFATLINEEAEDESTFFFGEADPTAKDLVVAAFPPGGTYEQTIEVGFRSDTGVTVHYSLDGGPLQVYSGTPPINIYRDATLSYYGTDGVDYSPSYVENYVVRQRGDVDTDGDSIPDFLEVEHGFNALVPEGDADGDGWDVMAELVRSSDPRDKFSAPLDSDKPIGVSLPGDGWPDFDEIARETDPFDINSAPVARGQGVAEYLLSGIPATVSPTMPISKPLLSEDGGMSDGSRIEFYTLTGGLVASASIEAGSFTVRLAGDQPYILKAVEAGNVDVVLLDYVPAYAPCLDLSSIYTPGMTAADWLAAYRILYTSSIFTTFTEGVVDASSTATVLALNRFFEQFFTGPESPPLVLPGTSELSNILFDTEILPDYNPDEVAAYVRDNLVSAPRLLSLVNQYLEWGIGQNTSRPIHELMALGIAGTVLDASDVPPAVGQPDFDDAAAEIDTLLASAPNRLRDLTGTLELHADGFISMVVASVTYELDISSFAYNLGALVHLTGRVIPQCEKPDVTLLQVTSLDVIDSGVSGNNENTDMDGLADQWEYYYFGDLSALPGEDPDTDTYTNVEEYNAYTDPLDGDSYPGMYSPTPTPSVTPTVTPTPPPTATATPTDTPTPGLSIFDLTGDRIIDAEDLFLFIHDMIHDPTSERSNFDGLGGTDHRDLFLFSLHWHEQQ